MPWLRELEVPFRIVYRRAKDVVTIVRVWRASGSWMLTWAKRLTSKSLMAGRMNQRTGPPLMSQTPTDYRGG